jgi:hypothetical protein
MALSLHNLDALTRHLMVEEINRDVAATTIYISQRLSNQGKADYVRLLSEAAGAYDDAWLELELNSLGRLNATETRRTPSGGVTTAKVPVTAAQTMAEGEFNRFYSRALCLRAISDGIAHVEVYRAKAVSNPRPESVAMIRQKMDPRALLNDLRAHPGMDTALGLPPGPNSGLSIKLP